MATFFVCSPVQLSAKLDEKFNEVKSILAHKRSKGENFVTSLETIDELKYHFCDSLARIFEHFTIDLKTTGSIENELENVGVFTPPQDVFMAWFVNAFVFVNENGLIVYKSLNVDVPEFI